MSFLFNRFASRSMINGLNKDMKKRAMSSKGGIAATLYQNVWQKSTIMYITYIVVGCVAIEVVYGNVTNKIWEMSNQGKLYHQIDWSKFKSEDDEDEEDE